ncbi:hypothetical protein M407DRAFT_20132 [Tulasnella calospora MUT 4182]|uniref:Uncharacterized protein n=1 Tax=Tulasnella calospora MUT 4182 TaxID=1051891 RepID=A0A0C3QGM2_9AGAM|nr:hypothetical protein M407DRAFT_20132 [Tulasnella calospora MUT 4182]
MSQWTNSRSSSKTDHLAVADVDKAYPSSDAVQKALPSEGCIQGRPVTRAERCQNDREEAPNRLDNPSKAPQEWEPDSELSEFDFDFTASPGAEEWQIGETADGRAVYSTVEGAGAGVTVEFQKWDW